MKLTPPRWTWRFLPKKTQRRLTIASVRGSMLFFGYDLSTVTDEDLEDNMMKVARLIARAMPTVTEVAEAMKIFARTAGKIGLKKADILKGPGGDPQSNESPLSLVTHTRISNPLLTTPPGPTEKETR